MSIDLFSRMVERKEAGGVILVALSLSFLLIFILGICIDLTRAQLAGRTLQNIADSLALASTVRLDGTKEGWRDAKRSAIGFFKANELYGAGNIDQVHLTTARGTPSPHEPNLLYAYTDYDLGNVQMRIERGQYARNTNTDPFEFETLEGQEESANSFQDANATKVTLEIVNFNTIFARVLPSHVLGISGITRDAIAAKEDFRS